MGIAYNNSIVRDGLVLHLDAANPKSYPGSGTTWLELKGGKNEGTLVNGVSYSEDNLGFFSFDGSNDLISIPYDKINSSLSGLTSLTVLIWVRLSTIHPVGTTVFCWPISNNSAIFPYTIFSGSITTSRLIRLSIGNGSTRTIFDSNLNLDLDTWNQVGLIWDGLVLKASLNSSISSNSANAEYILGSPSNNADLFLGTYNTNNQYWLTGNCSFFSIYNKALSEQEIQQNFNAMRDRYGI